MTVRANSGRSSLLVKAAVVLVLGILSHLALPAPASAATSSMGCATTYCADSCPDMHALCTGMGCGTSGAGCAWTGCFGIITQHWYDVAYGCGGAS